MKFRPASTTSERQLALALAESGRQVSLNQILAWRNDGLLPALASHGGRGGRTYYWREADILARAQSVYDSLSRHGRPDAALITLWIQGYPVPLPLLRRAWLQRTRLKGPRKLRRCAARESAADGDLSGLLLEALLGLGESLTGPESALLQPLLKRAIKADGRTLAMLGTLAFLTTALLETGDLMREAADQDLLAAQRHMRNALDRLADHGETGTLAEVLGPGLFVLALALLHTGQDALLEALQERLPAPKRAAKKERAGRSPSGPILQLPA